MQYLESVLRDQEWYQNLIDDCKTIMIERGYRARMEIIEGYHELGERVCTDEKFPKYAKGRGEALNNLAEDIGIGKTTLYYAIQFYEKYPVLSTAMETFKEGKDISWFKIKQKYLPLPKDKVTKDNWIRYYDVWNFADKLGGFGEDRPAQCPPQVILNFIYYFTRENDLIVDPMAGGGAMTDCANYLERKSLCYDNVPFPLKQVRFNDIRKGYPGEAKGCDAIFIDPPYGSQKGEVFKKSSVSNLSTSDYVEKFMKKLFIDSYNILNKGGMIGFIIQNQCHINLEGKPYWDFGFEAFRLMKEAGFIPYRRVGVPLVGPVQYQGPDMDKAKENKKLLGILRDLMVMIK